MNRRSDVVERQWRWTTRFFKFFPFWIALITGVNIWNDAQAGASFDPMHLVYAVGFLAVGGVVYLFGRIILKFVRGFVRHQEGRR